MTGISNVNLGRVPLLPMHNCNQRNLYYRFKQQQQCSRYIRIWSPGHSKFIFFWLSNQTVFASALAAIFPTIIVSKCLSLALLLMCITASTTKTVNSSPLARQQKGDTLISSHLSCVDGIFRWRSSRTLFRDWATHGTIMCDDVCVITQQIFTCSWIVTLDTIGLKLGW